jgi:hypothetical protein
MEDRGHQIDNYVSEYTIKHGLTGAPVQYGLLDNARRGRLGLSVADYRQEVAELFAPFSKVAAKNPFSSSPVERSVAEVATVTDVNRMIADPYPRLLVARDQVNQGVGRGDDPRGLTLTGGLPYFGGPGNSYSLHAIAETVAEMRDKPGKFGFVGANGGTMSKYSVGIYSTLPVDWRSDRSAALNNEVAALPTVSVTEVADGPATIETYSVRYDWPVRPGVIIGRLDADGSRFMALTEDDDLVGLMSDGDPLGAHIVVTSAEHGNRTRLA